jgi:hypothetical protein
MRERIEVTSEMGIVALGEPGTVLPAGLDQDALLGPMERMAHSGNLFFLVTDDPVRYRIDLVTGESPPPGPDHDFEGLGGVFRLEAPSGQVALTGWEKSGEPAVAGAIAVPPGTQLVSVLTRRPFDGPRHVKEMSELLGAEWHYVDKVNKLGLVGCLPLALTAIVILARQWHWLWYVLPLLAVSWLPVLILKRGERFKAAERRSREHERGKPHYVISLTATPEKGLSGGFLRV